MVPRVAEGGRSFGGALLYYLHDKQAMTSERVAWTETLNLPSDDPNEAGRVMAFTAAHQAEIKRQAGTRATGRKLDKPVFSFSIAWHPDEEPDRQHMMDAMREAIGAIGMQDCQALIVCHDDEPHSHVHAVINRVDPTTGKAASNSFVKARLSDWAKQYERQHGRIYCDRPDRSHVRLQQGFRRAAERQTPRREFNQTSRPSSEARRPRGRNQSGSGTAKKPARERTPRPKNHKDRTVAEAWERSDSGKAFAAALNAKGWAVAAGRRGVVAVDPWGKVVNIPRELDGVKSRQVQQRLADLPPLPDAKIVKQQQIERHRPQREQRREARRMVNEYAKPKRQQLDRQEQRQREKDREQQNEALAARLAKLELRESMSLNMLQDQHHAAQGEALAEQARRSAELADELQRHYRPQEHEAKAQQAEQKAARYTGLRGVIGTLTGAKKAAREEAEAARATADDVQQRIREQLDAHRAEVREQNAARQQDYDRRRDELRQQIEMHKSRYLEAANQNELPTTRELQRSNDRQLSGGREMTMSPDPL